MAEKHLIYHWKHGWIPLTHAAALSKAKGNPKLADKYVAGTSTHHAPRATAGVSARNLHTGLEPHKHTPAADVAKLKPGDHATLHGIDEHGHDITVTGTVQSHPKPVRIKHGEGGDVHHHYQTKIANRDGQATVYTHIGPEAAPKSGTPAGGIDREYFGKTGPELKKAADGGDPRARAELDRRAAKRAEKAGKPAPREKPTPPPFVPNERNKRAGEQQAPDMTPEQLRRQNQGDYKVGDRVIVFDGRKNRPGTVRSIDESGRLVINVPGYGGAVRKTAQDLKHDTSDPNAPTQHQTNRGDFKAGDPVHYTDQAGTVREGTIGGILDDGRLVVTVPQGGGLPPMRVTTVAAKLTRRDPGAGPTQEVIDGRALSAMQAQDLDIERALEARGHTGHSITTSIATTPLRDGSPRGSHTHYVAGDRVGSVFATGPETWSATYHEMLKPGRKTRDRIRETFTDREAAHAWIAERHAADLAVMKEREAKATAKRANAKSPSVHWQPHTIEHDGSARGRAAAAKIKQAYRMGDHTVEIESALNKEQTKGLLDDIHSVLLKSGHLDSGGIVFRVPTGDSMFRTKRTGTVGAYVRVGQNAIHINPKLADETVEGFGAGGRHFMPARANTNARQYVIAHELGHVIDHQNHHTRDNTTMERTPGGLQIPNHDPNVGAAEHHRSQRTNLSNYGTTNRHEGYAEAYAQWIHGGPGSNPAADAYALQYGWAIPAPFRHRGRI